MMEDGVGWKMVEGRRKMELNGRWKRDEG